MQSRFSESTLMETGERGPETTLNQVCKQDTPFIYSQANKLQVFVTMIAAYTCSPVNTPPNSWHGRLGHELQIGRTALNHDLVSKKKGAKLLRDCVP